MADCPRCGAALKPWAIQVPRVLSAPGGPDLRTTDCDTGALATCGLLYLSARSCVGGNGLDFGTHTLAYQRLRRFFALRPIREHVR